MKKITLLSVMGLLFAFTVSAHVVVNPKSVGVAARQVFTVSVPTEGDSSTTGLRLVIPAGITSVTPNVKPGWKITVKTQSTGKKTTDEDGVEVDEQTPVEIVWTGGLIPAGQRDEFSFATQAPANPTNLAWKAYQTYQDGEVVSWDQTPGTGVQTPYSITQVVNDLTPTVKKSWWETNQVSVALGISLIALVVSLGILMKKDNETKQV